MTADDVKVKSRDLVSIYTIWYVDIKELSKTPFVCKLYRL